MAFSGFFNALVGQELYMYRVFVAGSARELDPFRASALFTSLDVELANDRISYF